MDSLVNPIYLDYNATTPLDPAVFSAMEPYFQKHFGNPASAAHEWGWAAEKGVEKSRTQLASLVAADPFEITFTSGATESNNWVIFAMLEKLRLQDSKSPIHFLTSPLEHSSVVNAMKEVQRRGVEVDFVETNKYGQVEIETVRKHLKPHTKLMSFMWVNNEIGSLNPIPELANLARENGIYFHTDATQAVGKIPIDLQNSNVDFLSASAHKFYGPKGVGILFIRNRKPKISLPPFLFGGGQEHGRRSGTVNVPAVVGLGAAAEICQKKMDSEYNYTLSLRKHLWEGIKTRIPAARLNGHPSERSPTNLNITFPRKNIELLTLKLKRIGFSQGSACHTGSMEPSPLLRALGLTDEDAKGTLRLSLGRWTTVEELDRTIEILSEALA